MAQILPPGKHKNDLSVTTTLGFPSSIPDNSRLFNMGYLGLGPMTTSWWQDDTTGTHKSTTLSRPKEGSMAVAPNIYSYLNTYTVKPWWVKGTHEAIFTTVPGTNSYDSRPGPYGGQGITGFAGAFNGTGMLEGNNSCIMGDTKCETNYTWDKTTGQFVHETGLLDTEEKGNSSLGDGIHKELCYEPSVGLYQLHEPPAGDKSCQWTTEPYVVNCAMATNSTPGFGTYCPKPKTAGTEPSSDPSYIWFMGDYCSKNWENDSRCATFFTPPNNTPEREKAVQMIYDSRKRIGKGSDSFWSKGLPGMCADKPSSCPTIKKDYCSKLWPSLLSRNSGTASLCGCDMGPESYTFLDTPISSGLPAVSQKACYPPCFHSAGDTTCTSKYCALGPREVEYINAQPAGTKITYPKSCKTLYFSEVDTNAGFDQETKQAIGRVSNYSNAEECYTLSDGKPYKIDCSTGKLSTSPLSRKLSEGFLRPRTRGSGKNKNTNNSPANGGLFVALLLIIIILCFSFYYYSKSYRE